MKKALINILIYILFPSVIPLFFTNNINSKEYIIYLFLSYIFVAIYFTIIYKEELLNNIKKLNKKNILNNRFLTYDVIKLYNKLYYNTKWYIK